MNKTEQQLQASKLRGLIIDWVEELEEKTENATCQMEVARERTLGTIIAMSNENLLDYFQKMAEEVEITKPLAEMTDKEQLDIMREMFKKEVMEASDTNAQD
jgi:hypothetical protein